ncbi:zinc-finger of the MIZ type in Nse subunit-domain-containing protein [Nemania sp. NC0429]|nr:zinc-finger of the MIZ type in Nse subunit-domain-containing protein [Nemania sp. NC0429]
MPLLSGAQRNRNRGRPRPSSPSQAQHHRHAVQLPDYEPPSFPLNDASRRALAELAKNTDTRVYEEQLKQSITLLTNNVRDINDRYVKRKEELANLKKKDRSQSEDDAEDTEARKRGRTEEAAMVHLRETVPALTTECESAVRGVIDLRVELEDGRKAILDTVRRTEAEHARAAAADEGQEGGENRAKGEDGDDGDFVMGNARHGFQGPLRIWKNEQEKAAADYATRSLEQRYATDNDYIGFKRLWWDAAHGVDGKPLPDASRWFTGNQVGGDDDEDDEEDDLVIAEEHISIYCPLSMVVMEEPYTSTACKHTFNKPAIVQFLRSQPGHRAKCPQTGCSKEISLNDFYDDQVMLRKIKREQAEKERQNVDDEDEDGVDVEGDSTMLHPQSVKAERARDRGNQLLADLGVDPEEEDDVQG